MAQLKVFTLDNLGVYDSLIKGYVDTADAKSLKTVAIDGNTLKFYKVGEPVGETAPAYEITLPETDISGLISKLVGATAGNVVTANADGTISDGGVALSDLATKEEVEAVEEKADANTEAIEAINSAENGILAQAKEYADAEVKELTDGVIKTHSEAIETLNGDASTEGSVAKAVKDSADAINAVIGEVEEGKTVMGIIQNIQENAYDDTAIKELIEANAEAIEDAVEGAKITVSTATTTDGYLKTYTISQGGTEISKIDIPKDLVVTSGAIVVDPEEQEPGTYIELTIANQEDPIYINVKDLVDAYTAQQSATEVQLAISDTNEISATIVNGSVTLAKLATEVTDSIADAKKAGTDAADAVEALADGQVKTNAEDIAELQELVGDGCTAITDAEINALFAD